MGILTLLYDNSSGVFSKTMPAFLKTTLLLAIITVCSADSDFGGPYSSNDRFLLKKISEIYQAKRENSFKQTGRRQLDFGGSPEDWTGRWFPEKVTERPLSPALLPAFEGMPADISMWKMINSTCDDGKTNLTVDWSGSPINYTCFNPQRYFLPDYNLPNIIMKSLIPKAYKAKHECMQKEIHYSKDLPTFGTHRPAWPRYGEYKFVPRQRWLHSLEHGAIVFLYHPCAHPQLVNELRELVTGCLFRHIITPYTLLPPERPFALVAWGWALLMSAPDEPGAIEFIKKHALQGPELTAADGQFSEGLIQPAAILSDAEDSAVCPNQLF